MGLVPPAGLLDRRSVKVLAALLPVLPAVVLAPARNPLDQLPAFWLLISVLVATLAGGRSAGLVATGLATTALALLFPPAAGSVVDAVVRIVAFAAAAAAVTLGLDRIVTLRLRAERWRDAQEERQARLGTAVSLLDPLVRSAPLGICVLDLDLRYLLVNDHLATLNGMPAADHIGRPVRDVMPRVSGDVEERMRRALRTGRPVANDQVSGLELDMGAPADEWLLSYHPVTGDDGRAVGLGVTVVDITEQVRLTRELQRTAAVLDGLIEASPAGIALYDTDLRYQRVNAALAAMNGGSAADHVGRTLDEMAPGLPAEARAAFDRVARTGEPTDGLEIDGPAGGRFRISVFRVTLPDGTPAGLGNLVLDVTEGHRLQQLQRENDTMRATAQLAHRLEEAQRIARLGSFEWRIDGDVIAWSREMRRIVGTEASPAGVEDALRHVHPADVPTLRALYTQAADVAGPVSADVRWVRPDGAVRETVLSFELVRDDAAEPTGMWGTIQDVTDLRAAERRARETSRELEVEHGMLTLIQRSMLPLALPPVPDAELAATYLAVTDRLDLGGDWYDALPISDGRFLVAVGDVAGHDLAAAMTMAQVRNALRAYAVARPDPGHVLAELNDFVLSLDRSVLVTALVGVYDPVAATLRWACAGHDAPVVLGPTVDGEGWFRVLDRPAGMVLGVFPSPVPYAEAEIALEPGETVLWYTDGLIDHPAMTPDASEADVVAELAERLRQLAGTDDGAGALGVQEMIDRLAEQVLAERRQHDDICLLALRRGLTVV